MKQYQSLAMAHPGLWGHEKIKNNLTEEAPVLNQVNSLLQQLEALAQPAQLPQQAKELNAQWITIIGKPSKQFIAYLRELNIADTKFRIISPRDNTEALWATEQALLLGNSKLVIASVDFQSAREQKRLALIGQKSRTPYFLFSMAGSSAPLH